MMAKRKSTKGPRCGTLTREQIQRLNDYRIAKNQNLRKFHAELGVPFGLQVLIRALDGKPVQELNYLAILRIFKQLPETDEQVNAGDSLSASE